MAKIYKSTEKVRILRTEAPYMKDLRKALELVCFIYRNGLEGRWSHEIAEHSGYAKSTISERVETAEKLGLIERRGHRVYVTQKGKRLSYLLTCLELAGVDPSPLTEIFLQVRTFASDISEFLLDWLPSFPPTLLPPPLPPIAPNWIAEKLAIEEAKSNI